MTAVEIEDMYRLCAIAKYDDRYVIPLAHREIADNLEERQGGCGLDFAGGPGSCGPGVDEAEGDAGIDLRRPRGARSGRLLSITRVHGSRRGRAFMTGDGTASCGSPRCCWSTPDGELLDATPALRAAAADRARAARAATSARSWTGAPGSDPYGVQEEYVATFDFHKRASLHLSYFRDGDRRQRGATLLGLKRRYREAGLELTGGELPDYLPAILEFAAFAPGEDADADPRPDAAGHRAAARIAPRPRQPVRAGARRRRLRPARAVAPRSSPRPGASPARARRTRRSASSRSPRRRSCPRERGRSDDPARRHARGDVPLGRPALPRDRDVRRRPPLALAPRPVHLDHALDPAARGALAEDRQPALPHRPARGDRRPRHRHPRPEGLTDELGISENTYRIFSAIDGDGRRARDARRPRDPDRAAAAEPPRARRRRAAGTSP